MTADVLVVGGGVIGKSVALACTRRGARTTLLAPDEAGASVAAAGMLCPSFEALHFGGPSLRRIGEESLALWDGFAASLAAEPEEHLDYARRGAVGIGFPRGALGGEGINPPPGFETSRAVLVPGEGRVDPRALGRALAAAIDEAGVTRVRSRASKLAEGGGVHTQSGEHLSAGMTVIATGAAPFLENHEPERVRGRAFLVRDPVGLDRVTRTPSVYFCPRAGDLLYVGATEEERDMPSAPDALWHEACWVMPALKGAEILEVFDGVRPRMREGLPVIGPHERVPGLVLALGHHRNGILLAPYTAEKIAGLL